MTYQQKGPGSPEPASDGPAIILPVPRPSIFTRIRNWFLAGIIVTAPIGLTVYLVVITIAAIDRNVKSLIPDGYEIERALPTGFPGGVPGLGVVVAVVLLTAIGFLATNFLGRSLLRMGEHLVGRMPIVRGLYSGLKQIFETVFSQSGQSFRQVALVPWPAKGSWTVAFVTAEQTGEVGRRLGMPLVTCYVPTTPNPTGGYMVYFPRSEIVILDMSVDQAMKLIISCGVIVPSDRDLAKIANGGPADGG